MPKVVIVIPTYNERDNIEPLLKRIFEVNPGVEILFVDDNSPDKTADLIQGIILKDARIHLLKRIGKDGLARAYLDGFNAALMMSPDYIIQMDADLSHDPKYINDLLNEARSCDLVIGSRFIKGGKVKNCNWFRLMISCISAFGCRLITRINIKDPLGGFKCFNAGILKNFDFMKIKSRGYFFQLEMNYWLTKSGYSCKETPIIFRERNKGKSKLSLAIAWEALILVWGLRK